MLVVLLDLGRVGLSSPKRVDVEARLLCGADDHVFATDDQIGSLSERSCIICRNHNGAVLIGMNQIAIGNLHAGHGDRPREVDNVDECVRRPDTAGHHLEPIGNVGEIAHTSVRDDRTATDPVCTLLLTSPQNDP